MRLGLHEKSSIGFLAFIPIFAHREAQRVHWYIYVASPPLIYLLLIWLGVGEGRNVNVTVNKACQCGSRQSIHLRLYTCSNALRHGQGFGYSLMASITQLGRCIISLHMPHASIHCRFWKTIYYEGKCGASVLGSRTIAPPVSCEMIIVWCNTCVGPYFDCWFNINDLQCILHLNCIHYRNTHFY